MTRFWISLAVVYCCSCLTGCAFTVEATSHPSPPGKEGYSVSPSSSTINSHINRKIHQHVTVVISDKDLASEYYEHAGLVGYLVPVKVYPGQTLKIYSDLYLTELFDKVSFGQESNADLAMDMAIRNFDISAVQKVAHLEVVVTVKDKNGAPIYSSSYTADGEKHTGMLLLTGDDMWVVAQTTRTAYENVFNQLVSDLENKIQSQ